MFLGNRPLWFCRLARGKVLAWLELRQPVLRHWPLSSKDLLSVQDRRAGITASSNLCPLCLESARTVEKTLAEGIRRPQTLHRGPDGVWLCANSLSFRFPACEMMWGGESLAWVRPSLLRCWQLRRWDFPFKKHVRRGSSPKYTEIHWHLELMAWKYQLQAPKQGTLKMSFSKWNYNKKNSWFLSPNLIVILVFSPSYLCPLPTSHPPWSRISKNTARWIKRSLLSHILVQAATASFRWPLKIHSLSLCQEKLLHTWLLCSPAS